MNRSQDNTANDHLNIAHDLKHSAPEKSEWHYKKAIELSNNHPIALLHLANLFLEQSKFNDAINLYEQALEAGSTEISLFCNLSKAYHCQNRIDDALACCQIAQQLGHQDPNIENNLGQFLKTKERFSEALQAFSHAIELSPNHIDSHMNRAALLYQIGEFNLAWSEWHWRWQFFQGSHIKLDTPHWSGQDLKGKTLLVWAEQGVGDQVMFASMIPELLELGAHIIWECNHKLVDLMRRSFPQITVIERASSDYPRNEQTDYFSTLEYDYQCPGFDLICNLKTTAQDFHAHEAYLQSNTEQVSRLRSKYQKLFPDKKLIGISWRGGLDFSNKYARSLSKNEWKNYFNDHSVQYICLQYGDVKTELEEAKALGIDIYQDPDIDAWEDLDGLSAQIMALDEIYSIDNSTVHLSGALGKSCQFIKSPEDARWLMRGNGSAWYKSVY